MAELLFHAVDGEQFPQLVDNRFQVRRTPLAHGLASPLDQLVGAPDIGALAHSRGGVFKIVLPSAWIAHKCAMPKLKNEIQVPLRLPLLAGFERLLPGLVCPVQRRAFRRRPILGHPGQCLRVGVLHALLQLGPRFFGLRIRQHGIELENAPSRLLTRIEIAAAEGGHVAPNLLELDAGGREFCHVARGVG